ncbi:hypothetical protein [Thiothrix nivea]|uniref:Right handed beta helix domain-containing protein n=1 Tax=Thiothrix nivea (strain ATCC 35100 / DSM 5205 / JP2) TaxID=870187 RepID=A0A656HK08_THINJ|nr:hypothetical protein [Thiothrix nivea]EIJ36562.1 hypothetical protein Thini_4066 [Thiothrix nivea DSM 5205]
MKTIMGVLLFLLSGYFSVAWATEKVVAPGTGTLSAAIANASNGDTLVLQGGSYYGDFTIDKSLTLRASNRSTDALIAGIGAIQGEGIKVTIQGIKFSQSLNLVQAADIRLLQNHWLSGIPDGSNYKTSEGDGSLIIIGNTLNNGNITSYIDNAYIAGNTFLKGGIFSFNSIWVIGNNIDGGISGSGNSIVRILGNRIDCKIIDSKYCLFISSLDNLISNNIILDKMSAPREHDAVIYINTNITDVISFNFTNNIIHADSSTTSDWYGFIGSYSNTIRGNISGNIIRGINRPIAISSSIKIANNICFEITDPCPSGDGNLNADPKYVDTIDFKLAANSPAINAGPSDYQYADLDRSRNDIGAYGGPWSIEQYDIQRDPNNLKPYVYPLFKGGSAYSDGDLEVQAIGVAKLR